MKLELNTNGAWRTVLRGLAEGLNKQQFDQAKEAAATLARISTQLDRKPQSWRLVSEATERVVEVCDGHGWVQRPGVEFRYD
jgi:hypothetical protein